MLKSFTYRIGNQNSFLPNTIKVKGIEENEYVFKVLKDFSKWFDYDIKRKELRCNFSDNLDLSYFICILNKNGYKDL